jgi:hypothetical protein
MSDCMSSSEIQMLIKNIFDDIRFECHQKPYLLILSISVYSIPNNVLESKTETAVMPFVTPLDRQIIFEKLQIKNLEFLSNYKFSFRKFKYTKDLTNLCSRLVDTLKEIEQMRITESMDDSLLSSTEKTENIKSIVSNAIESFFSASLVTYSFNFHALSGKTSMFEFESERNKIFGGFSVEDLSKIKSFIKKKKK